MVPFVDLQRDADSKIPCESPIVEVYWVIAEREKRWFPRGFFDSEPIGFAALRPCPPPLRLGNSRRTANLSVAETTMTMTIRTSPRCSLPLCASTD